MLVLLNQLKSGKWGSENEGGDGDKRSREQLHGQPHTQPWPKLTRSAKISFLKALIPSCEHPHHHHLANSRRHRVVVYRRLTI